MPTSWTNRTKFLDTGSGFLNESFLNVGFLVGTGGLWTKRSKPTDTWTFRTKPTDTWTNRTKVIAS